MNKKIKAIIEFVKVHKKETIGVAVALGIAVIGIGGYVISNNYNSKTENNLALSEKKIQMKQNKMMKRKKIILILQKIQKVKILM